MKQLKTILALAFAAAALMAGAGASHAGVVIIFSEVGSDVVATTTGSILTSPSANDLIVSGVSTYGGTDGLYRLYGGCKRSSGSANWTSTGLTTRPSSSSGSDFGFQKDILYWDGGINTIYTPTTTWTWTNKSLSSLGLGSLTTTPTVVWSGNYGSGNTISYAVIPEANAPILCLATLWVLCLWRRR